MFIAIFTASLLIGDTRGRLYMVPAYKYQPSGMATTLSFSQAHSLHL